MRNLSRRESNQDRPFRNTILKLYALHHVHSMPRPLKLLLTFSIAANMAFLAWQGWQWGWPASGAEVHSLSDKAVVMRTPGGLLEVSTIRTEERFDSTTTHTVLGVSVGKTVAQIRVPAVYRYHIALAPDWTLRVADKALIVIAPKIQPSLPVAIDTGKLESFSTGIWSPITGADAIAALQKSITTHLASKAASPSLLLLQRESARQTVTEFIQKWLVQQAHLKNGPPPAILVFFEDEPLSQQALPLFTPE